MFARLKETIRILSYRKPTTGPDIVIVEEVRPPEPSTSARVISHMIEAAIVTVFLGYVAGIVVTLVGRVAPAKSASLVTIAGAVGALLAWIAHSLIQNLEKELKAHLNVANELAPYFGHRLDSTFRVLKGH